MVVVVGVAVAAAAVVREDRGEEEGAKRWRKGSRERKQRERREAGRKHATVLRFWLSAGLLDHLWRQ